MKVLMTGGNGLLASAAWLEMAHRWDLTLAVRTTDAAPAGPRVVACPLEEAARVDALIAAVRPDLIVHAAGMTNVEDCERHRYRAHVSNVIAGRNVARSARRAGVALVHVSTDHFAAEGERSTEEEIGFPKNNYALTKLQAEFEVLAAHPTAVVARTNFFAWGLPHRPTFFDSIVEKLRAGAGLTAFTDVRYNPLAGTVLLDYLDRLHRAGVSGVFNVVGDEVLTKYDFARQVGKTLGLDVAPVRAGKLAEARDLVPRPANLSLSNAKLKAALGIPATPSISEMLTDLHQRETDHKTRIRAAFPQTAPKFLSYGRQDIVDADYEAVLANLGSPYLTQGPKVEEFEQKVADLVGARYAVAMCNWTAGLHMAVAAAGVGPGDHVITSPLTFVASANCAVYAGATPHFADIDPVTLNLCPERVDELCRKLGRVRAIIPVHFAGAPCDMARLREVADRHGATLIEDAAHAIGGRYLSGEPIGRPRYSSMIGFSFHPVKNVTTGEGGMILTDDADTHRKLLRLRSHGITKGSDPFVNVREAYTDGAVNPWYYEMQEIGYNYRITDLQCALGLSQVTRLQAMHGRRVQIAQHYDQAFAAHPAVRPFQSATRALSGNHLYVVKVAYEKLGAPRAQVMARLRQKGVGSHVHYIPVYRQPFYQQRFPADPALFPHTEDYYASCLTLPLYPSMSDADVARVVSAVLEVCG